MKNFTTARSGRDTHTHALPPDEFRLPPATALRLVSSHELQDLRHELARGRVPADFETKLARLADNRLPHHFIEQHSRLYIALLMAVEDGAFRWATPAERERLLRVLAYVRKDDDAIPDPLPDGFVDDIEEVRAAKVELASLLNEFKRWRLEHQVPGLWLRQGHPSHLQYAGRPEFREHAILSSG